jgi:hypothetical protein
MSDRSVAQSAARPAVQTSNKQNPTIGARLGKSSSGVRRCVVRGRFMIRQFVQIRRKTGLNREGLLPRAYLSFPKTTSADCTGRPGTRPIGSPTEKTAAKKPGIPPKSGGFTIARRPVAENHPGKRSFTITWHACTDSELYRTGQSVILM